MAGGREGKGHKDMAKDLDALLNGHLDGRLDADQAARLRARLAGDPALARRLKALEALRADLRLGLPRLDEAASRRVWEGVRARVRAQAPAQPEAAEPGQASWGAWWSGLWARPWVPAWGFGLAGAAAALALVFLLQPRPSGQAPAAAAAPVAVPGSLPAPSSPVLARASEGSAVRSRRRVRPEPPRPEALASAAPAPASVPAPVLAGLPASGEGATEVERALADSQSDDELIGRFLSARPESEEPVVAMLAPAASNPGSSEDAVAYQPEAAPVLQEENGGGVAGVPRGGREAGGYWNWAPAAQAMNQRDWAQARVELGAAADQAGSPAERAFAHSALRLLAAAGGPLEGESVQNLLPAAGELSVLGAGTWQLLVDGRLARFGRGVAVRLPGLREDGDSFLLDLGSDRGQFSPGSHFVRVGGEAPARVVDASGQPVQGGDFYAPAGADYDLSAKVLRLR